MFSLFDSLSLKKVIFKPNNFITKMSLIYKYETKIWSNSRGFYFRVWFFRKIFADFIFAAGFWEKFCGIYFRGFD